MKLLLFTLLATLVLASSVCTRTLDVMFLIDNSMPAFEFSAAKSMSHSIAQKLAPGSKIGWIQYGETIAEELPLSTVSEVISRLEHLDQISQTTSDLAIAIRRASLLSHGARVVVFTHKANHDSIQAATDLKQQGIEVYAVAFDGADLTQVVSAPAAKHLFSGRSAESIVPAASLPTGHIGECRVTPTHVMTFDGHHFPTHTVAGDVILVKSEGLIVQTRKPHQFVVVVGREHIDITPERVLVDGHSVEGKSAGGVLVSSKSLASVHQYELELPQGDRIRVLYHGQVPTLHMWAAPHLAGATRGLCGQYQGCAAEHLLASDETPCPVHATGATLHRFIQSWRATAPALRVLPAASNAAPAEQAAGITVLPSSFALTPIAEACTGFCQTGFVPVGYHSIDCLPWCVYPGNGSSALFAAMHEGDPTAASYIPPGNVFQLGGMHTAFQPQLGLSGNYTVALFPAGFDYETKSCSRDVPLYKVAVPVACAAYGMPYVRAEAEYPLVVPANNSQPKSPLQYGFPQVRLIATYELPPFWRNHLPWVSWKLIEAVGPNNETLTPASLSIVTSPTPGIAYLQAFAPGRYTIEVALSDGCTLVRNRTVFEARCHKPALLAAHPDVPAVLPRVVNGTYQATQVIRPRQVIPPYGVAVTLSTMPIAYPAAPAHLGENITVVKSPVGLEWTFHAVRYDRTVDSRATGNQSTSIVGTQTTYTEWTPEAAHVRNPISRPWPFSVLAKKDFFGSVHPSTPNKRLRTALTTESTSVVTQWQTNVTIVEGTTTPVCTVRLESNMALGPALSPAVLAGNPTVTFTATERQPFDNRVGTLRNCLGTYSWRMTETDPTTSCTTSDVRSYEVDCGPAPIARLASDMCSENGPTTVQFNYLRRTAGVPTPGWPTYRMEALPATLDARTRPLLVQWKTLEAPLTSNIRNTFDAGYYSGIPFPTRDLTFDAMGKFVMQLGVSTGCNNDSRALEFDAACPAPLTVTSSDISGSSSAAIPSYTANLTITWGSWTQQNWPYLPTAVWSSTNMSAIPVEYVPHLGKPVGGRLTDLSTAAIYQQRLDVAYPGSYAINVDVSDQCRVTKLAIPVSIQCSAGAISVTVPDPTPAAPYKAGVELAYAATDSTTRTSATAWRYFWVMLEAPVGVDRVALVASCQGVATCKFTPTVTGVYRLRHVATDGCLWGFAEKTTTVECPTNPITGFGLTAATQSGQTATLTIAGTGFVNYPNFTVSTPDALVVPGSYGVQPITTTTSTTNFFAVRRAHYFVTAYVQAPFSCNPTQSTRLDIDFKCDATPPSLGITAPASSIVHAMAPKIRVTGRIDTAMPASSQLRWVMKSGPVASLAGLFTMTQTLPAAGQAGTTYVDIEFVQSAPVGKYVLALQAAILWPTSQAECDVAEATVELTVICPPLDYVAESVESVDFRTAFARQWTAASVYTPVPTTAEWNLFEVNWVFTSTPVGSFFAPQDLPTTSTSGTSTATVIYPPDHANKTTITNYQETKYDAMNRYRVLYTNPSLCFAPDLPGTYVIQRTARFVHNATCNYPTRATTVTFKCPVPAPVPQIEIAATTVALDSWYHPVYVPLAQPSAPGANELLYRWELFGNTSTCQARLTSEYNRQTQAVFYKPGVYTVTLYVSDGCNVVSTTVTITVLAPAEPELVTLPTFVSPGVWAPYRLMVHIPNPDFLNLPVEMYEWRVLGFTRDVVSPDVPVPAASTGMIVAITVGVVGGLALIAVVLVIVCILCRMCRRGSSDPDPAPAKTETATKPGTPMNTMAPVNTNPNPLTAPMASPMLPPIGYPMGAPAPAPRAGV